MGVTIDYKLTGRGWAECRIEIGDQTATVSASYLSDALGDLVFAAARLAEGSSGETVSFAEEPGEFRWRFSLRAPDRLLVRIKFFRDTFSKLSDGKGKTVFEAECRLRTFCGAVLSASQNIMKTYGAEGYRAEWVNNDFPIRQQERLKAALDQEPE